MSHLEQHPASDGFRGLMQNRAFVTLWSGQIISQIGDKIFFVLLIALVVNYPTPQVFANSMRSAVMIANTLPAVLFGSAAGIFVDRWSKKQILWITNLGRGLLVLMIPLLPRAFALLLLIAFLESILTQFFAPAEQSAISILVKPQNLMTANALFTTTMMGSLVVGFAIGEPLLSWANSWVGQYNRELLVGGIYVAAAMVLMLLPMTEQARAHTVSLHPWQDLQLGFKYLQSNRLISNAMVQLTVLYCVFAALAVLTIGLAEEIGLRPEQFGFLLAAAGVGLILGAAFLGQWGDRLSHWPLSLVGFVIMGIVLLWFSFVEQLWLGLLLSVLLGWGAALVGVPMQTLIQRETPSDVRGKVFGFQNNMVNIALSLPLAIAGLLADTIGLRTVLVSMGLIVILSGTWAWRSTRQALKKAA
ncbi:MFS transporter [Synechococcales cyanobacterium C]|uniref:MFS transporter n=2 Tax=Petrachloros TaxID=2918834 RepID=A0A8K2A0Z3_9CYAN|nr:MFS transporter [Petrachloros mirabilis ULC683]